MCHLPPSVYKCYSQLILSPMNRATEITLQFCVSGHRSSSAASFSLKPSPPCGEPPEALAAPAGGGGGGVLELFRSQAAPLFPLERQMVARPCTGQDDGQHGEEKYALEKPAEEWMCGTGLHVHQPFLDSNIRRSFLDCPLCA